MYIIHTYCLVDGPSTRQSTNVISMLVRFVTAAISHKTSVSVAHRLNSFILNSYLLLEPLQFRRYSVCGTRNEDVVF